ncbi:hypothetical protein [Aliikangiella sp. G2MR2-5]|uniref:hypothetical protein n=1 Tax=Aliikangiella sp. G2MR2-5 TaxID=2788943 RepID=UPI0018A999AC|nr:hypothetical protein [Aliikangiella sp. G2MR2-5]
MLKYLSITFVLLFSISAQAHHPEISADAVCDETTGEVNINYESWTWDSCDYYGGCGNTRIDILLNGVVIESNSFSEPDYRFSGSYPAPVGAQPGDSVSVTALAVDAWSNGTEGGQSRSTSVTIPDTCTNTSGTGRFTGGGHQIRVDAVRITRGFTLHCDLLLSNNLEINWKGNHFHMKEHMETVACTDDPDIIQAPPEAPVDTIVGVGQGHYNNEPGYTIEFTLVDAGEPGGDDQAAFKLYETANPANVIMEVPLQSITGGNIQAHADQPHK